MQCALAEMRMSYKEEQDLLGQVSRLRKREELKLCKFILESCNLKVLYKLYNKSYIIVVIL